MKGFLNLVIFGALLFKNYYCLNIDNSTLINVRTVRTGPKPPWNETFLDKLRNVLLTNYDKYARPGQHYEVTTVNIGLVITYLETDELNSTVSVSSWLKLNWFDPKLKWNKDDYGGIDVIKMADHEVWLPDIYLYNSASGGEFVARYGNPHAVVHSDGKVFWIPPSKLTALCEFDLYYWPFDTQYCYLKFASWTHSGKEIKLELFEESYADFQITTISAWEVNSTSEVITKYHDCCPDVFYNAQFNLTLRRSSLSYVAVVITPVIAVASLILIQYCLPSQSGERIILSCCTAIMVTMLLIHFIRKVSAMGRHTPWIVSFYSVSLYMISISIVESIFVLLILNTEQKQALPWKIKKHLQGRFGKWIMLEHYTSEYHPTIQNPVAEEMKVYHLSEFDDKVGEKDVILKSSSKNFVHREWEILAVAIDRLTFLIYSFVFFVMGVAYLL